MAVSKRIFGAALILKINNVDRAVDITEYNLKFETADSDTLTFAEVGGDGGDVGKLSITAIQSTDTASFWTWVWENAGTKDVAFALAPHGNATATAEKPHITGKVDIGLRPALGGAADPKKAYTFEVEWDCKVDKTLKKS